MKKRLLLTVLATAFAFPAMAADEQPTVTDPQQLEEGAQVYSKNCAVCHGADLEGQPNWRQRNDKGRLPAPPHNVRGHTWHHDDATLFGITKLGTAEFTGLDIESDMPAFKDILSDDQIRAVLAYIKSRWPARTRAQQESINRRAAGH